MYTYVHVYTRDLHVCMYISIQGLKDMAQAVATPYTFSDNMYTVSSVCVCVCMYVHAWGARVCTDLFLLLFLDHCLVATSAMCRTIHLTSLIHICTYKTTTELRTI